MLAVSNPQMQRLSSKNVPLATSLVLASALACGMVLVRVYLTHSLHHAGLIWNLLLAWVPLLWSLKVDALYTQRARRWRFVLPGLLWLIFLPNAPYLITDFIHLRVFGPWLVWYDLCLLALFAWTGSFLAIGSLRIMHRVAEAWWGRVIGWMLILSCIGLCGVGIYLGRFLRWNSWDLLFAADEIVLDLVTRLADPHQRVFVIGTSLLFAAWTFIGYLTFALHDRRF